MKIERHIHIHDDTFAYRRVGANGFSLFPPLRRSPFYRRVNSESTASTSSRRLLTRCTASHSGTYLGMSLSPVPHWRGCSGLNQTTLRARRLIISKSPRFGSL